MESSAPEMIPEVIANRIAVELGQTGLSVCAGFLSETARLELRADLDSVHAAGSFHRAATGRGDGKQIQESVRRDEVYWLERSMGVPAQIALWARLDQLRQALNRQLYLGLQSFEGHYAVYPPAGFYRRHLDTFRGDPGRVVSLVLYLNDQWSEGDRGELRIYAPEGSHRDIPPVGGTLVCFLSQESEHEVLASTRPRASFTGWFKIR